MRRIASLPPQVSRLLLGGAFALLSSPAFAEVADKVATPLQLGLVPVVITVLALIGGRRRAGFALLPLLLSLLWAWVQADTLGDPFLRPAIRAELGDGYVTGGYLSAALGVLGPVLAWALLRRRRPRG
jgi:hypothetical protein